MWLGTGGPLLVSSPVALCGVGGGHGELGLGGGRWRLLASTAPAGGWLCCSAARRRPLGAISCVWACPAVLSGSAGRLKA
jgi:hypothetical protein